MKGVDRVWLNASSKGAREGRGSTVLVQGELSEQAWAFWRRSKKGEGTKVHRPELAQDEASGVGYLLCQASGTVQGRAVYAEMVIACSYNKDSDCCRESDREEANFGKQNLRKRHERSGVVNRASPVPTAFSLSFCCCRARSSRRRGRLARSAETQELESRRPTRRHERSLQPFEFGLELLRRAVRSAIVRLRDDLVDRLQRLVRARRDVLRESLVHEFDLERGLH